MTWGPKDGWFTTWLKGPRQVTGAGEQELVTDASGKVVLVAAGEGIVQLKTLAVDLAASGRDVVLVHRFHDRALARDDYRALTAEGIEVITLPGRRRGSRSWFGELAGAVDDVTALRVLVPDLADRGAVVAGPAAWRVLVRRSLTAAGVPSERVREQTCDPGSAEAHALVTGPRPASARRQEPGAG